MKFLKNIMKYYIPILILIIVFYGVRLWWWHYVHIEFPIRPPLVIVQLFFQWVIFAIVGTVVAVVAIIITLLLWRTTKSMYPVGFLYVGIGLMMLMPLPQIPKLPEVTHFQRYRTDYEHMLDLILRESDPKLDEFCPIPLQYQHLSQFTCIGVNFRNSGLFVIFNPTGNNFPIVYIENDDEIDSCLYDFYIEQKIDNHWYVCYGDWN